jgi:hypothetical protein
MLILQDLELSLIEKEALAKKPSFLLVIFTQLDLPFDKLKLYLPPIHLEYELT